MKHLRCLLIPFAALTLVLAGCAKKGVDTSRLEKSFSSGPGESKGAVDEAVRAIKAGDYGAAMASLQQAASQARLTPQQEAAIKDVVAQVQEQMRLAARRAAGEAEKAMGDLKKSLSK